MTVNLFSPFSLGSLSLPNRIVLAPLTRMRAGAGLAPVPLNATYYAQRAGAGLIVSEATQISQQGQGYVNTPGIYSEEQIAGWRLVTDAVHERGGRIFLQLWHVGRQSHPLLQPGGGLPVAPSAIVHEGVAITQEGPKPLVVPRALETDEIPAIVEQYRQGAINAQKAGFDGVEIHSANGYLLDQFLHDGSNQRTDRYGGSIENRARLLLEVIEAVLPLWESKRVGVRLSPSGSFGGMSDSDPQALFTHVVAALNSFDLAYLHLVEPRIDGNVTLDEPAGIPTPVFREIYRGTIISAGGHDKDSGNAMLAEGTADLIAYGRLYIANPDLPERFRQGAPLNPYDRDTFYGGDEKGYTDYPFLEKVQSA
ncbi:alkene reductase [Gloeobacter kilaueensis]|uniref:N-ethylmaleimide reductase n=1 Tax=Gloeobacter kilaueensis (strain ATCC BAA-2537 / CCAP 1431/1 / ULC 316 / JS1) TaxID=1183438 RepID=U5QMJ3_GLOK1|nr:alkene reductase [Gloeobacter kilaueensis]AGY60146.1 N-ethylmaleimide reductase [Gloeobacter kilaueensis JS1]